MISINQAVILCGGMGTRLRPLTDNLPKPMAPVNGVPFLQYLIFQMKHQGIYEFLLLTGYLSDAIKEYFGNGADFGVNIRYSEGPAEWETAKRIWEAQDLISESFILLYSDNYTPININRLANFHDQFDVSASVVLCQKSNGNIKVDDSGMIKIYDSTRKSEELDFVEIGYTLVKKSRIFKYINGSNESFSNVLARLVIDHNLSGMKHPDKYQSISDLKRLRDAETFLSNQKIILIDRDGTINQKAPRGEYIAHWKDFHFIDDTVLAMQQLSSLGFSFIVISNQAGIGRGMVSQIDVDDIHHRMISYLSASGILVHRVYYCPHHWEDNCNCRKPNPGLFLKASEDFRLLLDRVLYIGDDPRDSIAAENANSRCILLQHSVDETLDFNVGSSETVESLSSAIPSILQHYRNWDVIKK